MTCFSIRQVYPVVILIRGRIESAWNMGKYRRILKLKRETQMNNKNQTILTFTQPQMRILQEPKTIRKEKIPTIKEQDKDKLIKKIIEGTARLFARWTKMILMN